MKIILRVDSKRKQGKLELIKKVLYLESEWCLPDVPYMDLPQPPPPSHPLRFLLVEIDFKLKHTKDEFKRSIIDSYPEFKGKTLRQIHGMINRYRYI
jgi:hypothetical protein